MQPKEFKKSPHQECSILTPKIPSVLLTNFAVSDLLGGIHFFTKTSMRT
jgi:hypothetical protein